MSDLVGNPNCWFSHAQAHFIIVHVSLTSHTCKIEVKFLVIKKLNCRTENYHAILLLTHLFRILAM